MKNEDELLIKFGKKLKAVRLSKDLSQEKLATLAGLHPTYISQVERGKRNPTLVTLSKIISALNCTISELLQEI